MARSIVIPLRARGALPSWHRAMPTDVAHVRCERLTQRRALFLAACGFGITHATRFTDSPLTFRSCHSEPTSDYQALNHLAIHFETHFVGWWVSVLMGFASEWGIVPHD